jgi:hypothetical protein
MTGIDAPTIMVERREIAKTLKNLITEHTPPLWSAKAGIRLPVVLRAGPIQRRRGVFGSKRATDLLLRQGC